MGSSCLCSGPLLSVFHSTKYNFVAALGVRRIRLVPVASLSSRLGIDPGEDPQSYNDLRLFAILLRWEPFRR
jgi:hypothetical protein